MTLLPPPWTAAFDAELRALAEQVVEGKGPARLRAWQQLLQQTAPHVERWASGHRVLRAVRLTSEDEARAVLVRVVERLQRGQHENLRAFLSRGSVEARVVRGAVDEETQAIERFAAFATLDEEPPDSATATAWMAPPGLEAAPSAPPPAEDDLTQTPLRAWLKGLTDYAVGDHAVARLGRRTSWHTPSDTQLNDKRQVNSDAKPFSETDAGAFRPAITDLLTLREIVSEVSRFMEESVPENQRRALQLRLDDASYAEIALDLGLSRPAEAERLVRAAKERLRVAFRAQRERFGLDAEAVP